MHDNRRVVRDAVIKIDNVVIQETHAARRNRFIDGLPFRIAVHAVKRILPILEDIQGSCAERVLHAGVHASIGNRVFFKLRLAGFHFGWRLPSRPWLAPMDDTPAVATQIHPGQCRHHNAWLRHRARPDKGSGLGYRWRPFRLLHPSDWRRAGDKILDKYADRECRRRHVHHPQMPRNGRPTTSAPRSVGKETLFRRRTYIAGLRTNEAPSPFLLQHMRRPSCHATGSKDIGKAVAWKTQHLQYQRRVEFDVCL